MATLIIIPVFAIEGNKNVDYAKRTLANILKTTNLNKHRLFISDNGSCDEMIGWYEKFKALYKKSKFKPENLIISLNGKNLGTAGGVNQGIRIRRDGEFVTKRDADTTIKDTTWIERMEECMRRYPRLGLLGLKRSQLIQRPDHPEAQYRTQLVYLPHQRGLSWEAIEICDEILGTCTMFHPDMLDVIGYTFQHTQYGFDDNFNSIRSKLAGFVNAFMPSVPIEHIDDGTGEFVDWKKKHAGEIMAEFNEIKEDYIAGVRDIYYDGCFKD